MKKQPNEGFPNPYELGASSNDHQDELDDALERNKRNNECVINIDKEVIMNKTDITIESLMLKLNKQWAEGLCAVTEKGNLKWNVELYGRFLPVKSFQKLRLEKSNSFKYIHIEDYRVVEADPDYVKDYVLKFLNNYGSEELKDSLKNNNIYFSQQLMDNLRERIPYDVYEDGEEFLLKEGILDVSEDGFRLLPWY